ncbi:MAG: nucleotidyl transferase AbiEii/AbiGii toxin family protein [Bacteroidia bacterium]|nr:nucleotidyl transferase AbiEii/AbiGii toxin family protein [Bacteroidia bacterium]
MSGLDNLLPETRKVLLQLASLPLLKNFTLVGGSALTIHLGHRLSEDIDLFSWQSQLSWKDLHQALSGFESISLRNFTPTQADFFINGVKITFFANNWQKLQQRIHLTDNLYVADLEVLAIMKVNTLFLRATFRDYYDLYVLHREKFSLPELYKLASNEMANLTKVLFQKALIYTEDIPDEQIVHLAPKYHANLQEITLYFEKQIKLWNKSK